MIASGLQLVAAPLAEIMSIAEAKQHLRITTTSEDTYIGTLIVAARNAVEAYLHRVLVTQQWDAFFDEFPSGDFLRLPFGQLQSVASVKYTDSDDTESTFDAANYDVVIWQEPGGVVLKDSRQWPTVTLRPRGGVVVRFTAGYGDAATNVEAHIIHAAKLLVEDLYQNRETTTISAAKVLELPVYERLLQPFRLPSC